MGCPNHPAAGPMAIGGSWDADLNACGWWSLPTPCRARRNLQEIRGHTCSTPTRCAETHVSFSIVATGGRRRRVNRICWMTAKKGLSADRHEGDCGNVTFV